MLPVGSERGGDVSGTIEHDEQVVVLGAGPAGLAAAAAASAMGVRPLLIEAGPSLDDRDQSDPTTVVEGVGGAGLFSDGKFSFRPSASRLWDLDPDLLALSWAAVARLLRDSGVPVEARHAQEDQDDLGLEITDAGYVVKSYPSIYGTPESRRRIVDALWERSPRRHVDLRVHELRRNGAGWAIHTSDGALTTRRMVLATGRFGPELLALTAAGDSGSEIVMTPRRLEVGVRIQQQAEDFFLRDAQELDPKLMWDVPGGGFAWRTFCCCRDGLVVPTQAQGLRTVSGRADCPPTGMSNVGFNLRVTDTSIIDHEWPGLRMRLQDLNAVVEVSLEEFLAHPDGALGQTLGGALTAALAHGLRLLQTSFPDGTFDSAQLLGPTLEGIGRYPAHDHKLQAAPGLWVAGDVTGSFRGLTAALVSGYMAGTAASTQDTFSGPAR